MNYQSVKLHPEIEIGTLYTIHYFEYTNDFIFCGETHNFGEFLYVDKGEVIILADEKQVTLEKDDIIFHRPNEFHAVRSNGTVAPNLIVISFDCVSPAMHFFERKILKLSEKDRHLLAQIIIEARHLFSTPLNNPWVTAMERVTAPPFGCEQMIKLCLEQFLVQLIRRFRPESHLPDSTLYGPESDEKQYRQIIVYLENHLNAQLTLSQICQDNLISYSQLTRLFHKRHNCSIMKFFSNMKINTAKQLIRAQSLNFTQIAEMLGYSSVHYFSRHFKELTGMTPTEYAKSAKMISEMAVPE